MVADKGFLWSAQELVTGTVAPQLRTTLLAGGGTNLV
jgi:hypothetical protein